MKEEDLVEKAFRMLRFSYCPYSHFPVGAALLCSDGSVYTGCNVENAAYGDSICAERCAVLKAVSEGHRDDFIMLAIAAECSEDFCWPCGSCRQFLSEFAPDLQILCAKVDHTYIKVMLSDLLPHSFRADSLK